MDPSCEMERTYRDAIRALNTLQSNFATIDAIRKSGINKNAMLIPEMIEWTRRIGYKPDDLSKMNVVHITGTKGKGSTSAFVQSILYQYQTYDVGQSGIHKIGLYTSPHLKSVRERVAINGKAISEELFTKYFFEVWDKLCNSSSDIKLFPHMGPGIKPVYFKFLTLLSFHVFIQEKVDSAIYEVGVGGQFDSTNIVPRPTCTGITSLGIDHTVMLGNTIEEIAWNKAGIFKQDVMAFTVPQPEEAMEVIKSRALEKEAKGLKIVKPRSDLSEIKLGLAGDFQVGNASIAVELAACHLNKIGISLDVSDTLPDEFITGLQDASWPGRCQVIKDEKEGVTWFLDGAHTKESVEASSKWFSSVSKTGKKVLLFNQQTRNVDELIQQLHQTVTENGVKFDHVVFTTNVTWSSGTYSDDLISINTSQEAVDSLEVQKKMAEVWNGLDKVSRKHIFHDIETSVNFIRSLEGPLDVFVCGSLHLAGGFLVVLDGKRSDD